MFSDSVTLLLAIYVGCHIFITVSGFASKTYKNLMDRVDNFTADLHTVARSVERISHTFDTLNRSNNDSRFDVAKMFLGVFSILMFSYLGINSSTLTTLIRIITSLMTAYTRGERVGQQNDQFGMNASLRDEIFNTITRQIVERGDVTSLGLGNISNVNLTRPPQSSRQSLSRPTRNDNLENSGDSDTESDVSEIVIEHTENITLNALNSVTNISPTSPTTILSVDSNSSPVSLEAENTELVLSK